MAPTVSLSARLSDPDRLAALGATRLLDSAAEPEFDRLTRLAKRMLDVPTALISLVTEERQFFKSCIGVNGWPAEQRGTPIAYSFCRHVVHSGEPLAITNAREDPLVRTNPAVSELDVVAYLGVPLRTGEGHVIGTLCAVDTQVRDWSEDDVAAMCDLAQGVMTEILLAEEVRALKRAEQALVDAAEAKARLLACVSHELRSPLNGILGFLDLLGATELTASQRDLLRPAASSGDQLLRIVNDVLDFSKLEAGKLGLDPHPFALAEAVEDVSHLLAVDAHAKGVEIVSWVDPSLPVSVHGDGGRLRQVLTNLVANAVKFTSAGEVLVRAERAGSEVGFSVADTGIGIAPERLPELFEPFEQAEASTARRYGGTGLGLTITRELVELLGGRLRAESEPGRGSTFSFAIPLDALDAAPVPHLPGRPRVRLDIAHRPTREVVESYLTAYGATCTPGDEPDAVLADGDVPTPIRRRQLLDTVRARLTGSVATPTVLVAEDDDVNRLVIKLMLSKRGLDVHAVADGAQAVEAASTGRYDAVLMDCEMPVVDGFSATALLRAAGIDVPIIAMTGHVREEDRERCLQAGMNDHLAKPIERSALEGVISRWLTTGAAPNGTSAS